MQQLKKSSKVPKDPNMLYSYINLKLRDEYGSLDELCSYLDISQDDVIEVLACSGFEYDEGLNQFR